MEKNKNEAIEKALSEYVRQLSNDLDLSAEEVLDALKDALLSAVRKELDIPKEEASNAIRIEGNGSNLKVLVMRQYCDNGICEDEALEDWVEFPLSSLSRVSVQTAENTLKNRMNEKSKEKAIKRIAQFAGEVVTAKVIRKDPKTRLVLLDVDGVECVLEPADQLPTDRYIPGETIRCLVLGAKNIPQYGQGVSLSRSSPELLRALFTLEVPEVADGVVRIMGVARKPGRRSKVAVMSIDPRLDPQGACIGYKGQRIQAISKSLANEKIDVVRWDTDPVKLIENVLSPGKVDKVEITDPKSKIALVHTSSDNIKVVVGEDGENVELAEQLTGWTIDVREGDADEN
ncbi:NusA N-terminal domain-containing protein [Coprothermobacter platensis]|uniref:NusA N-terminal domain-containing protein n=1 Tax=Coprothermobacter platensis TaxID=108819 RepID=UPI000362EE94|nr:NusA N-terminal domain-containing protein [Coprothermobacter platensis]